MLCNIDQHTESESLGWLKADNIRFLYLFKSVNRDIINTPLAPSVGPNNLLFFCQALTPAGMS